MRKKDFHRNWCGAAWCLALMMALSGCSSSIESQGNQALGAPSVENAVDNQLETENQQTVAKQDIENQQNMPRQDIGNQQNMLGQGSENQQNTTGQDIGNQQDMTGQDLGYHQYDEQGQHHQYDEPVAGHHSTGNMTGQAQNMQNPAEAQNGASGSVSSGNNGIDMEAAKSIALQNAGIDSENVVFIKAELDYDDGVAEYEIEFVAGSTKYEYEINAANGMVLKSSQEAVEQNLEGVTSQAFISVDEAKAIALNNAQFTADQVVYTKSELDYDDGRAEYEIEFYAGGKEYSFTIDATSGTILEMEID